MTVLWNSNFRLSVRLFACLASNHLFFERSTSFQHSSLRHVDRWNIRRRRNDSSLRRPVTLPSASIHRVSKWDVEGCERRPAVTPSGRHTNHSTRRHQDGKVPRPRKGWSRVRALREAGFRVDGERSWEALATATVAPDTAYRWSTTEPRWGPREGRMSSVSGTTRGQLPKWFAVPVGAVTRRSPVASPTRYWPIHSSQQAVDLAYLSTYLPACLPAYLHNW